MTPFSTADAEPRPGVSAGDTAQPPSRRLGPLGRRPLLATPCPAAAPSRLARQSFHAWAWCAWGYCGLVLAWWGALDLVGDRAWWGSIFPLLPAWPLAVPLLVLIPTCAILRGRSWRPLAAAAVVLAFPLRDFCIPWQCAFGAARGPMVRLLTCNLASRPFDMGAFQHLIDTVDPDVITVQERHDTALLTHALKSRGYHVVMHGPSLLTAARFPFEAEARHAIGWNHGLSHGRVAAPWGTFSVINTHLTTPRWELEALWRNRAAGRSTARRLLEQRSGESSRASQWVGEVGIAPIISGDFNLTVKSALYRRDWSRYRNAFSWAGWGWGYTRHARFLGARIDHVLCASPWRPARAWVGPDIGSDHRPLIVDLRWEE